MAANQSSLGLSRELSSCEIYRRMCDDEHTKLCHSFLTQRVFATTLFKKSPGERNSV